MTRTTPKFVWMVMVAASVHFAGCSPDSDDAPKRGAPAAPAAKPADTKSALNLTSQEQKEAGIQVQTTQPSDVAVVVVLSGTLVANQDRIATVVPRLPGRIVSAPVPLGAVVRTGQTLAVLESIELGEAQAVHRQAQSEATLANAALERAHKLAAEDIIAQKDLQRARADAERAGAGLRASTDKLRLLGVAAAPIDRQRDAVYPIVAPLSGTVIEKHAVPGAMAESDPLFIVADLSTVWLEADVFEKDLGRLKTGTAATLTVAAYSDRVFPGRLTYLSATMDTGSRTVKARIEVPNTGAVLKPGMFASARLATTTTAGAMVLPAPAVTLMHDKATVFVVTPQGFEPRTVETATRPDGSVEIKQGLAAGEKVVVAGAYALKSRLLKSSLAKDD